MNKKALISPILGFMVLLAATAASGQTAYFNAITNLNPAGYWPMHEVEAAAAGDIETNYGTLGLLGTGYYPDWVVNNGAFIRQVSGALTGDSDTALHFSKLISSGAGAAAIYTNQLYVPHTSPLSTLNPPFSVEMWYYPTIASAQLFWGQFGFEGFNAGNEGHGDGSYAGMVLSYNGAFTVYGEDNGVQTGFGNTTEAINNWYHLVVTCDASTNVTLYVNGSMATTAAGVGKFTPDYWSPMTIGGTRGGTRSCSGILDEFAVYTNVISDISTHYSDGISGGAGAYFHDVTNDNPTIYLRMDAPTYVAPGGTWPVLSNYGMTNGVAVGNGVYNPGTMPGVVTNSIVNPNGVPFGGVSNTVAQLSGVSSFADAGYAPAYNPVGAVPFSVTALFRGNPCDNRNQAIVGHSDNSWSIILNTNGLLVFHFGTNAASALTTVGVYNDGKWHQAVAVYAPASNPNVAGTNALFVDGALAAVITTVTTNGIGPGTNLDVMIGSDPQYTNNPAGVGRQFAGQVCDVAFFTNALTVTQVQMLYSNCGVAPFITGQPVSTGIVVGGTGTSTNFSVTAEGSANLAYRWYHNGSPSYSGATNLTDGIKYTNSTTSQVTITNLTGTDSGYYFVVITNNYGSVTSALASMTINVAPAILAQFPIPYTNVFSLYAGASPTFSITASGAQPITYLWYTNGVLDGAATGTNLVLTNVQIGSITNYCKVTNSVSSATSMVWTASVLADPTNSGGGLAPYPQAVLALNPIGYWRLNEGPDDGNGDNGAIAHDYAGGNDGIYTNMYLYNTGIYQYNPLTDPSGASADFSSYSADCDAYGIANINFGSPTNTSAGFTVEAWVNGYTQSKDARIVTLGYAGSEQFDLDTGSDSAPTSHGFRFMVRDATGASNVVASTVVPGSGWYHLVGVCDEANSNMTFYINGQSVGSTPIALGSGLLPSTSLMTIGSGMSASNTDNNLQFSGYISDVAVYSYALNASQIAAQYSQSGNIAPFFIQPVEGSVAANVGLSLTIPAMAGGTTNLGYYWKDVNAGTNVAAGVTNGLPLNATVTASNVPRNWNNDQLELVVTNAYGMTNAYVMLTVYTNAPQIITNLPAQVSILSSDSYTYSIGVSGAQPYYYQWYYNAGIAIAGETNSTYSLTAGYPGSTNYFVIITNIFGATTSSVSTFTSLPLLITQDLPPSVKLLSGASYTYSIGVAGSTPYGYQWYNVTTPLANQTNSTYAVTAGSPGSVTTYSVVITNIYGAVTSTVSTFTSIAQLSNSFAAGILQFNPAGYWPMHEVEAAAAGDIETNYGSLGLLGTGYYPDWAGGAAVGMMRGVPGALTNDSDAAVHFTRLISSSPGAGTWTNELYVPHTSPLSTLKPPFSVECWFYPTNSGGGSSAQSIWGQHGFEALNAGYAGNGDGPYKGIQLSYNGSFQVYVYSNGVQFGTSVSTSAAINQWHHLVATCDANTNIIVYVDGTAGTTVAAAGLYMLDYWTPLTIGGTRGGTRACAGTIDEFAVYTNVIGDIGTHYTDGTSGGAGAYFHDVTNDNPIIYLRMDAPAYTAPSVALWPELVNYGSVGNPGVYTPGTMPGIVAGPTNGVPPYIGFSGTNVPQFSGVSSFADAGYASAYNPVGATPFSVTALFRGNPCDNRIEAIVGHGDNSWRILMNTNGTLQCQLGTNTSSTVSSAGVYNDGYWHQAVEVYTPNSNHALPGVNALYVDGALDSSVSTVTPNGILPGTNEDVMIGSDPDYTNNPAGVGRQFAGQVCEAAFFTSALTATQVQDIYNETIAPAVNTNPTNIVFSVTGNQLTLSWPADHIGWRLQSQTNALDVGISTNWYDVSGSTGVDNEIITINPNNPTVFYRLIYP